MLFDPFSHKQGITCHERRIIQDQKRYEERLAGVLSLQDGCFNNRSFPDQQVERFGNFNDFFTVNNFKVVFWGVCNLLAVNVIRKPF